MVSKYFTNELGNQIVMNMEPVGKLMIGIKVLGPTSEANLKFTAVEWMYIRDMIDEIL